MHTQAIPPPRIEQIAQRSPIAITGPMAPELLGDRDIELVAHPFVIVHVCGAAGGYTSPWGMRVALYVMPWG